LYLAVVCLRNHFSKPLQDVLVILNSDVRSQRHKVSPRPNPETPISTPVRIVDLDAQSLERPSRNQLLAAEILQRSVDVVPKGPQVGGCDLDDQLKYPAEIKTREYGIPDPIYTSVSGGCQIESPLADSNAKLACL